MHGMQPKLATSFDEVLVLFCFDLFVCFVLFCLFFPCLPGLFFFCQFHLRSLQFDIMYVVKGRPA